MSIGEKALKNPDKKSMQVLMAENFEKQSGIVMRIMNGKQ